MIRSLWSVSALLVLALPTGASAQAFTPSSERAPQHAVASEMAGSAAMRADGSAGTSTERRAESPRPLTTARPVALARPVDATAPLPAPKVPRENNRTNTGLMITGLAAVLIGAAVGDDAGTILIVGGSVVGLLGLYRVLQ